MSYSQEHYYLDNLLSFSPLSLYWLNKAKKLFETWEKIFKASYSEYRSLKLEPEIIADWLSRRDSIKLSDHLDQLKQKKIFLVLPEDPLFPRQLLDIPDCPNQIYWRGNINCLKEKALAIVGSRKASRFARSTIEHLLKSLSDNQITIVSGLAFGVDSLGHETALSLDWPTVAVLAGGIDDESIYPANNYQLAQNIIKQGGVLLSEYPPKSKPRPEWFIARNRIIAGLAQATLIVECSIKSGSLWTAQFANKYNRSVLSVPGSILDSTQAGNNKLIQEGALVAASAEDLAVCLEIDLSSNKKKQKQVVKLSPSCQLVLECLRQGPKDLAKICLEIPQLTTEQILADLALLELEDLIKISAGENYYLISP